MKKTVIAFLLLTLLSVSVVSIPASAQTAGNVSIPDVGNVSVLDGGETNIEVQLTQQTWISNITFRPQSDEAVVRLQTNRSAPTGITINEIVPIQRADGSVEVAPQEFTVRPDGTTVITVLVRSYEGCQGFSISTRYERNSTVIPSDGCQGVDLIDRNSRWSDVVILVGVTMFAIFLAVIVAGLIHRKVSKSQIINVFEYINNNRLFR